MSEVKLPLSLATILACLVSLPALPAWALAQDKAPNIQGPITITSSSDTSTLPNADSKVNNPITSPGAVANDGQSTGNLLADSPDQPSPATTGNAPPSPSSGSSKINKLGKILKSNIVETFELDPRLEKDLTQGDPLLRPIKLIQDNFAIGYNPSITWHRDSGPPWITDYSTRALSLYWVGPVTKHLSTWLQMTPQANVPGFFEKWELFQGMANYGNDKNFVQIRGGQGFDWENVGLGGADRTITLTTPGVYTAFNGFDPTSVAKTISLEATGLNWTTGKVFGYWQQAAGTSSDPNIMFHQRGYGIGLSVEKLLGKTGISAIQSNLTIGNTPVFNSRANAAGNAIGTQSSPFIWWTSWINRSFQDKQGYVRLNPSFGLTVFNVRRYLDDATLPQASSTGYGYTFDLVAIPVRSYWTTVLRFDNFRSNDLTNHNTTYTFTVGQAFDLHTPNKGRIRLTFDYQFVGQRGTFPSHRIILGFWPIW